MKKLVIILVIFFSSYKLMAQDTAIECKNYAWGFYPCINYYNINLTSINSKAWMLERPRNNEVMTGIGVNYGNPDMFYVSADMAIDILTTGETSGTYNTYPSIYVSCYSYRFSINGYYLLLGKKKFGVYANLGTSFANIFIHSENYTSTSKQDSASIFENLNLKQNFLMNAGLSIYFYNKKLGYATGVAALRAGYDWAPLGISNFTWYDYSNTTRIKAIPVINFNGLYVGVTFNIWFFKNSKCPFYLSEL